MKTSTSPVSGEIVLVCRALGALDRSVHLLAPPGLSATTAFNGANGRPARKLNLPPKRRAQLKLQGQYIGYIRQLRPKQKAEVKKVREKQGMKAAIRSAQAFTQRRKVA